MRFSKRNETTGGGRSQVWYKGTTTRRLVATARAHMCWFWGVSRVRGSKMVARIFLVLFVSTVVVGVAAGSIVWDPHFPEVTIYVDPQNHTVAVGDVFVVDVEVEAHLENLYTAVFDLNWTGSVLNCTRVIQGDFLEEEGFNTAFHVGAIDNALGYVDEIKYTRVDPHVPGASFRGRLARVEFLVLSEATTPLYLLDVRLLRPDGSAIDHYVLDGFDLRLRVQVLSDIEENETTPLAGAHVTIYPTNKFELNFEFRSHGTTDENGVATFILPKKTSYSIYASAYRHGSSGPVTVNLTDMKEKIFSASIALPKEPENRKDQVIPSAQQSSSPIQLSIPVLVAITIGATATIWFLKRRYKK